MDDNTQLPPAPAAQTSYAPPTATAAPRRSWRDRLPSGRKAVAAGAIVAGLAIGGAGFGAGYAVGDDGASAGVGDTTQTTGDWGGFPGDGHGGPMGDIDGDGDGPMGQLPGGPMGGTTQDQGGTTGQAPDFDGDGQPDTDSGSTSGSSSDSSTQNG